jgi:hypothetical protein
VSVVNGLPATNPTYTFLDGVTTPAVAEYELCLKCHSGFTKLLPKDPAHPSRDMLDAAVEFNPTNDSYHPVEAAGRNQTPKMALSLSGDSPYKLWNFTTTGTVRCTNCHSSAVGAGASPAAGSDLAPHTSANRGILIAKYEDRILSGPNEAYTPAKFALCFTCHTDSPFNTSGSTAATNFTLHRKHVAGLSGNGIGGTDIDTPGDGQGNALCAECHFRPHSTGTTPDINTRLVTFAPDVLPYKGVLTWTPTGTGSGTCTLTCHGFEHDAEQYLPSP